MKIVQHTFEAIGISAVIVVGFNWVTNANSSSIAAPEPQPIVVQTPIASAPQPPPSTPVAPAPALQFDVSFSPEVDEEGKQTVEDALAFWSEQIKGPENHIKVSVTSEPQPNGPIASAMPTAGEGVGVREGHIKINPLVFKKYDKEAKTWIVIHEVAHLLGMTEACGMNGNTVLELDGETVKTGTPGHFEQGVDDLMTPSYSGSRNLSYTMQVLKKCGYQIE